MSDDKTTPADVPAPRSAAFAEFRARLRRISLVGVLLGVLVVVASVAAGPALMPERKDFPDTVGSPGDQVAYLRALATEAANGHEFTRAHAWFREARQRESDLRLPTSPVTSLELQAAYESGAARNMLFRDARHREMLSLIFQAMEQTPDGQQLRVGLNQLVRGIPGYPSVFREVFQYALTEQLMRPTLRRMCRLAAGVPEHPSDDTPAQETSSAEIERRLRGVFSFIRDTVAVVPDRELRRVPGDFRYPLRTMFHGYGTTTEVNWLLVQAIADVCPQFESEDTRTRLPRVIGVEFVLAPPAVRPRTPPEMFGAAAASAHGARVGAEDQPGPGRLVMAFVTNGQVRPYLFAFDAYAGVPLLDPAGNLLDVFSWLAGRSDLHPLLERTLPYGSEPDRLRHGQVNYFVTPLAGELALRRGLFNWLRVNGLGKWDAEIGPWQSNAIQVILERFAADLPASGQPEHASLFPHRWNWIGGDELWIQQEFVAACQSENDPHTALPPLEREALGTNQTLRQVVLDYRRPGDAGSRYSQQVYQQMGIGSLRELAWPIEEQTEGGSDLQDFGRGLVIIRDDGVFVRPQGNWQVGVVSGARPIPFLVLNVSGRPMVVDSITWSGPGTSDYRVVPLDPGDSPTTIRHGAICEVYLRGLPRGADSASVMIQFMPADETLDVASNEALALRALIQMRVYTTDQDVVVGLPRPPFGSGMSALASAAATLMPVAEEYARRDVTAVQARYGTGWAEYMDGEWENAERTLADYIASLSDRTVLDHSRLPALWFWHARFLRSRALTAIRHYPEALLELQEIPVGAPCGVAARLLAAEPGQRLLVAPTPYVD